MFYSLGFKTGGERTGKMGWRSTEVSCWITPCMECIKTTAFTTINTTELECNRTTFVIMMPIVSFTSSKFWSLKGLLNQSLCKYFNIKILLVLFYLFNYSFLKFKNLSFKKIQHHLYYNYVTENLKKTVLSQHKILTNFDKLCSKE